MNDLISRQAAIDAIEEDKIDLDDPKVVAVFKATGDFEKAETQVMTCDRHIKILKDLPSAQPERKKGTWINYDKKYMLATCSKCNKITMFELWGTEVKFYDYCPNCGCEMER